MVKFLITFPHQFLEGHEVVDSNDLVHYTFVNGIGSCFFARLHELFLGHPKLGKKASDQLFYQLLEIIMYFGILQLVLLLVVEDYAILV